MLADSRIGVVLRVRGPAGTANAGRDREGIAQNKRREEREEKRQRRSQGGEEGEGDQQKRGDKQQDAVADQACRRVCARSFFFLSHSRTSGEALSVI